jgi:uncharacterized membrane protein YbhN (UPF0104 family)
VSAFWSALASIGSVIGHAKIGFVLAAVAVDTGLMVLQSFRWRLLLRSLRSGATLWETFLAYAAGVCICNVTPARAVGGDAARAALIRRPEGSPPFSAVVASVVYDRVIETSGVLILAAIALPALTFWSPYRLLLTLLLAVAGVFAARPLLRRILLRFAARHQAIVGQDMRTAAIAAFLCSLLAWLLDITRITLVGAAFDVHFTPSQAAAVALLRLAGGVAPVPGGIGVVDGALIAGFMWTGAPRDLAAALAIVERGIVYGWDTALGAVSLLLLGGVRALNNARAKSTAVETPAEITT